LLRNRETLVLKLLFYTGAVQPC